MKAETTLDFGPFRLLTSERLLMRDGMPVPVGGRAFDILMTLIGRRAEVVSKDELIRSVWGNQVVEDNTLAVHLSGLRKVLGEDGGKPRYIRTIAGRGYQFLGPVAMAREAAPSSPSPGSDLPHAPTPMFGRDATLLNLTSRLETAPLLTLSGPGGIGKTRLALALAERLAPNFSDGVWWIDLTPIDRDDLVAGTVARALQLPLIGEPVLSQLAARLEGAARLLVFDNCEHVIGGVAELVHVLQALPRLKILATSREPLQVAGEQVERLAPLALPAATATLAETMASSAIELFVTHIKASDPDFVLNADNVAAVVQLCRDVEGVPLALELVASDAALLGVGALARRFTVRALGLTSRRRDAVARHHSLRAVLDWSYARLTEMERAVLRRLAVFAGGCTLDSAEAVVADADVPEYEIAGHMASLIAKSLVIPERTAHEVRYRLLEVTRVFAQEMLVASREAAEVKQRHARYYAGSFDRAFDAFEYTAEDKWLALYGPELHNVRIACVNMLEDPASGDLAVALAGASAPLFALLAPGERSRLVDQAMLVVGPSTPPEYAARLLFAAAVNANESSKKVSQDCLDRAAEIYRRLDDRLNLARLQAFMAVQFDEPGAVREAKEMCRAAVEVLNAADYRRSSLRTVVRIADLSVVEGRNDEAAMFFRLALDLASGLKSEAFHSRILVSRAGLAVVQGDYEQGIGSAREAIRILQRYRGHPNFTSPLNILTACLLFRGDLAEARDCAREAHRLMGHDRQQRITLELCALLGALEGRCAQAAPLFFFVEPNRDLFSGYASIEEAHIRGRLEQVLRAGLGPAELDAASREGALWSLEQATVRAAAILAG